MKTLCVLIPRFHLNHAGAIAMTSWGISNASLFQSILDEVHESMNELFACEIYLLNQSIYFCITAAGATIDILAGAIYTILPDAELEVVPDLTYDIDERTALATAEVGLVKDSIYPFIGYDTLKSDSMSHLVAGLSAFSEQDRAVIQMVAQPANDSTGLHFDIFNRLATDRLKQIFRAKYWFKRGVGEEIQEAVNQKLAYKLYRVNLRIATMLPGGANDPAAQQRVIDNLQKIYTSLSFVNSVDLNALKLGKIRTNPESMKNFQDRYLGKPMYLSSLEFTTLYHIPSQGVVPNTAKVLAVKGPPPGALPSDELREDICWFGRTEYREQRVPFGVYREDRSGHMYVIGNPGTGKSSLMQLLIRNDLEYGHGVAVLDPHGDLVDDVLKLVPEHRLDDVVIFDPTDTEFPISFNPLEQVPDHLRIRVAIGFIEMFKKLFEHNWSERLEHLLRYTVLALLSTRGTTMLSIRKMLSDADYRKMIAQNVSDYTVRNFWMNEFERWSREYADEALTPLLDRVGQFLSSNLIRNVVCQPVNRLRLREIMDTRKILLIKISSGMLGEESSSLLGGMLIAKLYQAAMSRADTPAEQRQSFHLYVDEFQSFATSSFNEILSESRKYGLRLTIAHQYLDQLPADVRAAVLGNVANILSFRVGSEDAQVLASEFQPRFSAEDIASLPMRDFYVKLSIRGQAYEAFSGRTLDLVHPEPNFKQNCIENSRSRFAVAKEHAHTMLQNWEKSL